MARKKSNMEEINLDEAAIMEDAPIVVEQKEVKPAAIPF